MLNKYIYELHYIASWPITIATFSYVTSSYIVMFHNFLTAFYFSAYKVSYILIQKQIEVTSL